MNNEPMNDKLEQKIKIAFKQQIQSLDSETLHRLRLARETALSNQSQSKLSSLLPLLLPSLSLKWLTGAGAGLALAGVLTFMIAPSLMSSNNFLPLDDLDLIMAEGDMDLVTQLDFYQWIDDSSLSE